MTIGDLQIRLKEAGLRITPQRIAVLETVIASNHPTADQLLIRIRNTYPSVATGTIYKILETFVNKGIIRKIETQSGVMRYDAILLKHHHLQDENDNRIEDYFDDELDRLVKEHLAKKQIPEFEISDIKIQIIGKFSQRDASGEHTKNNE